MKHFAAFIGTCAVIWIFLNYGLPWAFVAALVVLMIFYKWPKRAPRIKNPAPAVGGRGNPAPEVDGITKAIQKIDPNDPEAAQKREFFEGLRRIEKMGGVMEIEGSFYHPRRSGSGSERRYQSRTNPEEGLD